MEEQFNIGYQPQGVLQGFPMDLVELECQYAGCTLGKNGARFITPSLEPKLAIKYLTIHWQDNHVPGILQQAQFATSMGPLHPERFVSDGMANEEEFFPYSWGQSKTPASNTCCGECCANMGGFTSNNMLSTGHIPNMYSPGHIPNMLSFGQTSQNMLGFSPHSMLASGSTPFLSNRAPEASQLVGPPVDASVASPAPSGPQLQNIVR